MIKTINVDIIVRWSPPNDRGGCQLILGDYILTESGVFTRIILSKNYARRCVQVAGHKNTEKRTAICDIYTAP